MPDEKDPLQMAIARHFARGLAARQAAGLPGADGKDGTADIILPTTGNEDAGNQPDRNSPAPVWHMPPFPMEAADEGEEVGEDTDWQEGGEPTGPDDAYEAVIARIEAANRTFERAGRDLSRKRAKLASLPFPWIRPFVRVLIVLAASVAWYAMRFGAKGTPGIALDPGMEILITELALTGALVILFLLFGESAGRGLAAFFSGSGLANRALSLAGLAFYSTLAATLIAVLSLGGNGNLATQTIGHSPALQAFGGFPLPRLALFLAGVFVVSFLMLPWIGGGREDPAQLYSAMRAARARQRAAHREAMDALARLDRLHEARKLGSAGAILNRQGWS